jgi:glycosyltransferase involved in cell wall biosynthesis
MSCTVLVNGISARTGGGKEIFDSFLNELLNDPDPRQNFLIVSGRSHRDGQPTTDHVAFVDLPFPLQQRSALAFYYLAYLPLLVRRHNVQLILNFADLVIPTSARQIYFFDWSYLVYPDSPVWRRMGSVEYLARRTKLHMIRRLLGYPTLTLAQSELMGERLENLPGVKRVEVVPSAISPSRFGIAEEHDFGLPASKVKLLCMANYAPHKNIELVLPVARLLKASGRSVTIVTTLAGSAGVERRLLRAIELEGLHDFVINVGAVDPSRVSALYRQCDALFFPTLLESFGLPFYEAMYLERTIITSDLDFARDACGDAAFYFDPFDPNSALEAILEAFEDDHRRADKIRRGKERALSKPEWPQVYRAIKTFIDELTPPPSPPSVPAHGGAKPLVPQ